MEIWIKNIKMVFINSSKNKNWNKCVNLNCLEWVCSFVFEVINKVLWCWIVVLLFGIDLFL